MFNTYNKPMERFVYGLGRFAAKNMSRWVVIYIRALPDRRMETMGEGYRARERIICRFEINNSLHNFDHVPTSIL